MKRNKFDARFGEDYQADQYDIWQRQMSKGFPCRARRALAASAPPGSHRDWALASVSRMPRRMERASQIEPSRRRKGRAIRKQRRAFQWAMANMPQIVEAAQRLNGTLIRWVGQVAQAVKDMQAIDLSAVAR